MVLILCWQNVFFPSEFAGRWWISPTYCVIGFPHWSLHLFFCKRGFFDAGFASRWWTSPVSLCDWTPRSTLTSLWSLHLVVAVQDVWRGRTWGRPQVEVVLLMRMKIKCKLSHVMTWCINKMCLIKFFFVESTSNILIWPKKGVKILNFLQNLYAVYHFFILCSSVDVELKYLFVLSQ